MLLEYFTPEQIEILFILMCASSMLTIIFLEMFKFAISLSEILVDSFFAKKQSRKFKEKNII